MSTIAPPAIDGTTTDEAAIDGAAIDEAAVEAFAGRLFMAGLESLELLAVDLGIRLGLYEALAGAGSAGVTSDELAGAAGVAERYAREWLEQQAASGIVTVDDVGADAGARRFALPPAHAHVLLASDS